MPPREHLANGSAHYQGGPIGYGQREFEIAPARQPARWWGEQIAADIAVAWNPSLPGGAKDEDTYLTGTAAPANSSRHRQLADRADDGSACRAPRYWRWRR